MVQINLDKSLLLKGGMIALIVIITIVGFKASFGGSSTGAVIANDGVLEVTTVLQGFKYQPDIITVKKGSTVRLTIDNKDNVNHGLHLPQFGIVDGIPGGTTKTVEFIAIETSTNGQAVPTCSQEHGEKLTINVI